MPDTGGDPVYVVSSAAGKSEWRAREECVCGNVLRTGLVVRVRVLVCRCASPGRGPRVARGAMWDAGKVTRQTYEERTRLGLPLIAPCERVGRLR